MTLMIVVLAFLIISLIVFAIYVYPISKCCNKKTSEQLDNKNNSKMKDRNKNQN